MQLVAQIGVLLYFLLILLNMITSIVGHVAERKPKEAMFMTVTAFVHSIFLMLAKQAGAFTLLF
jgi:hypothetical protein